MRSIRQSAMAATAMGLLMLVGTAAYAAEQAIDFDIPAESLADALTAFSQTASEQIIFSQDLVRHLTVQPLHGHYTPAEALRRLLSGTKLRVRTGANGVLMIEAAETAKRSEQVQPADGAQVEEVIVSAEKRTEIEKDVPIPMTVVNTQKLTDNGQVLLKDYFNSIPGFVVTPGYEQNQALTLRGITTGDNAIPTVDLLVDGVPFGSPIVQGSSIPDIDPGDLDRIEVLRGPQGTLYGASSLGGLINYVTKAPSTDGYSGRVEFGTELTQNGAEPGFQVRGSVNIPVTDDFAIRVSGFERQEAGYIDDPTLNLKGVNEVHSSGGRFAALWEPSDYFSISVSALYQDDRGDGVNDVTVAPGVGDLQQKFMANTGPSDRVMQAYSATIKADFGVFHFQSLTGFNSSRYHDIFDFSADFGGYNASYFGSAVSGAVWSDDFRPRNFTEELRATTTIGENLDVLIGGFMADDHNHVHQIDSAAIPASGQVVGTGYDGTFLYGYHEYAAFVDLTYRFTDRLSLQVGGRYSAIENRTGPYSVVEPIFTGNTIPVIQSVLDAHFSPITYLVTPQYKISDDMMVYGRFSTGFRPGGGNVLFPGVPATFNPDTTKNYELGFKGGVLDDALFVDASLYYVDWSDIQIRGITPSYHSYLENGGRAKSEGVELSIAAHPWAGVSLSAWGDYDDAVLTQDFPASSTIFGLPGNRLPLSPTYSANFTARQEFPLWGDVTGFAGGTISYVGDRTGDFRSSGQTRQDLPGFTKVDLSVGAKVNDWSLNIYANNVTDERGVLDGGADSAIPSSYFYIRPRTVGISASKTF